MRNGAQATNEEDEMSDVTVKRVEEFDTPNGGGFCRARAGLGVTAFGMQVENFPPNFEHFPEHDHADDGQEEVYTLLAGAATLHVGGEEYRARARRVRARRPRRDAEDHDGRPSRASCSRSAGPRARPTSRRRSPRTAPRSPARTVRERQRGPLSRAPLLVLRSAGRGGGRLSAPARGAASAARSSLLRDLASRP